MASFRLGYPGFFWRNQNPEGFLTLISLWSRCEQVHIWVEKARHAFGFTWLDVVIVMRVRLGLLKFHLANVSTA